MSSKFILATAVIGFCTGIVTPALAQVAANCAPRAEVIDRLSGYYGEALDGGGLQSDSTLFEVWVSKADRNWTILMTDVSGLSCIMAAGTDWSGGTDLAQISDAPV